MFTRKILFLFSFLFLSISAFAQPINDDCAGIIDLGEAPICPAVLDTFNNVGATESIISTDPDFQVPACFNGGVVQRDVWFSFTIPTDGSIVDFQITVTGVDGPNGSIIQPQIAVYRGDCLVDELQELDCATSPLGATEIIIDLEGLTPGLEYFLRIEDWSASAAPNEGDFVLCIDEAPTCFNLCDTETESASCEGKLYDSGGPDGDYSNNENCTFTICPSEFHQCIFINVVEYNMEQGFDDLTFYAGEDTNAPQIFQLTGAGNDFEVQAFSDCVTIQFTSDGSATDEGFFLEWMCSPDTCTIDPPSTCDDPTIIPNLPYDNDDLTTCFAGNSITTSPCNNFFITGEEYIFTYDSPGDECIMVDITGSDASTGVAVYNECPNTASECVAIAGGNFGQVDPTIGAAFLETAGTYYIVVANPNFCTDFNIEITQVECPTILPPANDCDDAVGLNGCGNQPSIISVSQEPATNLDYTDGCWGGPGAANFTWFVFQAQEDGNFGFLADDNTGQPFADIDINVWGPFDSQDFLCDSVGVVEPIRSTYSGLSGETGLTDIHPVTGAMVTDICEGAGGDKFVSTIDVLEGEWYVILINDFGGTIENGEINMDFTFTSDGVLGPIGEDFSITSDTAICPGETVQLLAEGGNLVQWVPDPALSCTNCPNPIADISETTTFQAAIFGACGADTLEVEVGVLQVDAGPDLSVCLNEQIQIIAGANFSSVTYEWTGGSIGMLSCTDCPDPIVTATMPGIFTYEVTVTGVSCSFADQMTLEIIDAPAPDYSISDDLQICNGETVEIGGADTGINYSWTSVPIGFTSNEANPSVTPNESTTYILQIENTLCPVPSFDSVFVEVSELPIALAENDTTICEDDSVQLSLMEQEDEVTYLWTPINGLDNPNSPTPIATPQTTTTYTVTSNRNGCENTASITVTVINISVEVTVQDTFGICIGESIDLAAFANPATDIVWTPNGSLDLPIGTNVIATPIAGTQYFATVEIDGCIRRDSVYIRVDSLPDLAILPSDTTVCQGEQVLLTSPIFEPALYQDIIFEWTPTLGQLTPDSLFNMVILGQETTVYQRIATNGFCSDTTFANIEVITAGAIEIDPVDPICAGDSVQLLASTDLMGNLAWNENPDLSCLDCPNPTATPASTSTYQVTLEGFDCPVEESITVEVIPLPTANINNTVLCPNEDITLNPGGNPNFDYTWFSPDDMDFNSSTETSPVVMPTATSQYFVTVTNGDCPEFIDSLTVFVETALTDIPPMDLEICSDETGILTYETNLPGTITWSGLTNATCMGCSTLDLVVDNTAIGINQYTVNYINDCGEIRNFTVDVEVFEAPTANLNDELICLGDTVLINAGGSTNFNYAWSTNATTPSIEVNPATSTTFTVSVTNGTVCQELIDSATVNVISDYTVTIMPQDTSVTPNQPVTLTATAVFTNGDTTAVPGIYTWFFGGNPIASTQSITQSFEETGIFGFSVSFEDNNLCGNAVDSTTISVIDVQIPNAFTPNGDDNNSQFGLVTGGMVDVLDFRVYNRWGNTVYEVRDTDSDMARWNGGKDNDMENPLPADVYLYYIQYQVGNSEIITARGDVTLIR